MFDFGVCFISFMNLCFSCILSWNIFIEFVMSFYIDHVFGVSRVTVHSTPYSWWLSMGGQGEVVTSVISDRGCIPLGSLTMKPRAIPQYRVNKTKQQTQSVTKIDKTVKSKKSSHDKIVICENQIFHRKNYTPEPKRISGPCVETPQNPNVFISTCQRTHPGKIGVCTCKYVYILCWRDRERECGEWVWTSEWGRSAYMCTYFSQIYINIYLWCVWVERLCVIWQIVCIPTCIRWNTCENMNKQNTRFSSPILYSSCHTMS